VVDTPDFDRIAKPPAVPRLIGAGPAEYAKLGMANNAMIPIVNNI
jgi:hypothetical protein